MNIFISGGCKNGKSYFAQQKARDMAKELGVPLYYVATMIPHDEEDHARIKRHISERDGWGFETVEQGKNLAEILQDDKVDPAGVFLMDSVTALLANEMFKPDGFDTDAAERVAAELEAFARRTKHVVFVSDYIYGDAQLFDEWTEQYRRGLALIDRRLASCCDNVLEVSAGNVICHKGVKPLE